MSSYHTSFNYLGINSFTNKGLIVAHFDADQGEQETNLNLEPIYTDNSFGTHRFDYGAKYGSVAVFRLHLIKEDKSEFSVTNVRDCLRWLTGTMQSSPLELLVGGTLQYTFIGRISNVWNYKMDSRIIGLILEFTSNSPFAFSPKQTITQTISKSKNISINCPSDDLCSYVYMQTKYKNTSGTTLKIKNNTTEEETTVSGLSTNETVTIDSNLMITSSNTSKSFGNTFNFVFPRLISGINDISITGNGTITFEYIYPIKIGDLAIDTNSLNRAIDCTVEGYIHWRNILSTPTTLAGYGITDAYTKTDVDKFVDYLKTCDIDWKRIINTPTTVSGYGITDVYTKSQTYNKTQIDNKLTVINNKIDNITIDGEQLNAMLKEVLV